MHKGSAPLVLVLVLVFSACSSLPQKNVRIAVQTVNGKIAVDAQADGASVGTGKNAPADVAACVRRRFDKLESLGFGEYVKAFRSRAETKGVDTRITGCAFDGLEDTDGDKLLLPLTLHETTHLLGSILDGTCPNGAARCEYRKMRYRIFSATAPGHALDIPYVRGTPAVGSIAQELGADTMLDGLRMYLGLPSRHAEGQVSVDTVTKSLGQGDFYLLWDEWNAYLASLEIFTAFAAAEDCWIYYTFDSYETALSWPDLVLRYVEYLRAKQPDAYRALTADGRFGSALGRQLDRSEAAIGKAAKHECVRRPLPEVAEAEKRYVAAYGKLRAISQKP